MDGSLDPFDYHLRKCDVDSFKTLELSQFLTFYPHTEQDTKDEDDILVEKVAGLIETHCFNGSNEVVKILNQKCVVCYERDMDYAFRP